MRSHLALQLLFGACTVPLVMGVQGAGVVWVGVPGEDEVFLRRPSSSPSHSPSASPSQHPSSSPSAQPTGSPSSSPSHSPSFRPSVQPSSSPSWHPTSSPSSSPTYSSQPSMTAQQSSLRVSQKMSSSDGGMKVSQALEYLGFWLTWLIAAIIALAIVLIGTGVARKIRQRRNRRNRRNNASDEQNPDNMENQDEKGASFDIIEALGMGVDAFFDNFLISPGDVSFVGRVAKKSMKELEWEEQTEATGFETTGTGWCTRTDAETTATNFQY